MAAARIRLVARLGRGGSTLSPFVFWSTAAHVVFLGAMIILPELRPKKPIPHDAIAVELVAMPRPARTVEAPPKPAPAPPPPAEKPKPKPIPAKPKPLPEKPTPAPKQAPPRETPPPATETTDPAPGEAAGVVGDAGATVTPLAGLGSKFAWYRDSVTAALHGNWRRPVVEGLREPVEVRISFEILRDGSVRGLRVDVSSGVRILDRSALRAVTDAAPLPALPLDWREPTLAAAFVFRLHPE